LGVVYLSAFHVDDGFIPVSIVQIQFKNEGRSSCLRLNVSFGITSEKPIAQSAGRTCASRRMRSRHRHSISCLTWFGLAHRDCSTRQWCTATIQVSKRS